MTPERSGSYWLPETLPRTYPKLRGELSADVAVIGGGIVGITAALLLKRAGRRVALLEARRVGGQVSGHTTAKITSLHTLIYADLMRKFGEETARLHGEANEEALRFIADTVEKNGIDCGFSRQSAYTFCSEPGNLDAVREEADVAASLGLPAAFVTEAPIPVPIAGAVRFTNQAQFQPYRYLAELAELIPGEGCHVFEQTRVLDVEEGEPHVVRTVDGDTVTADHVIVATNLPILDRGGFFAKAYPRHHVAAAARVGEAPPVGGMFINSEKPTRSVRWHRDDRGYVLIATGDSYKPSEGQPSVLLGELVDWLRAHFEVSAMEAAWTNEDFDSMDRLPFVGRLRARSQRVWVATGFGAWGMTGGTAAAMILRDLIGDVPNRFAAIYDATRLDPARSAGKFVSANTEVAKELVRDKLAKGDSRPLSELAPGEAAVLKHEKGKLAAYRDEDGGLHAFTASCTHMGCVVAWNPVARTWDCPCHGSRFDVDGQVFCGPAVHPLQQVTES